MPFDGTNTAPSLTLLAEILRDRSRWPEGFVWNYSYCDTCAFGMAQRLWGLVSNRNDWISEIASGWFGISESVAADIFVDASRDLRISQQEVTPEHVADAIDAHLARP